MKKLLAVLMTVMVTSCAFAAESTAWPLSAETVQALKTHVEQSAAKKDAVPALFMNAMKSFRKAVEDNLPEERAIEEQHSQNIILQSIMMPMDAFNEYLENNSGNTAVLQKMAREFAKPIVLSWGMVYPLGYIDQYRWEIDGIGGVTVGKQLEAFTEALRNYLPDEYGYRRQPAYARYELGKTLPCIIHKELPSFQDVQKEEAAVALPADFSSWLQTFRRQVQKAVEFDSDNVMQGLMHVMDLFNQYAQEDATLASAMAKEIEKPILAGWSTEEQKQYVIVSAFLNAHIDDYSDASVFQRDLETFRKNLLKYSK